MNCKILLIFAALFVGGNAIKCYDCSATECENPPFAEKYLKNCDDSSCRKTVLTILGVSASTRSCGWGDASGDGCVGGLCTYSCKTDACNSSNSVEISILAMIGAIVSGFLLANY